MGTLAGGRELDLASAVKSEHEPAADHVLERPVLLPPVPGDAEFLGERIAALLRVLGDEVADEGDVIGVKFAASVAENDIHERDATGLGAERKFWKVRRSADRLQLSPRAGCGVARLRIAPGEEEVDLVSLERLRAALLPGGPEAETPLGKPLVTKPKSSPVETKQADHRPVAVAEDEDRSLERVAGEFLPAQLRQAIDALAEVCRIHRDEDLHVGRDLDHVRGPRKSRVRVERSAA